MITYSAKMLPQVDYQTIEETFSFSLTDLEYGVMQDCQDFLEALKLALMEEHLLQLPVLVVAHLCAYLGTAATVHTVHEAQKLEPFIEELIKQQAHTAYQHFNQHPINNTVANHQQKINNVEKLHKSAPGSIIVQTMRLGRIIMELLEELDDHRTTHLGVSQFNNLHPPKQTELFCPQETLIKIMLLVSSKKCATWRDQLAGASDQYVINQLAIQIGWLIGYFSHLDVRSPIDAQYFDYGLPIIKLYREHIYKLMHTYASARLLEKEDEQPEAPEALLAEIRSLSEKTHAQFPPIFDGFQKQTAIVQTMVEKTLIELITQNYSIKAILMSLFYFWFTLEASAHVVGPRAIEGDVEGEDVFSHMGAIIEIIKNTVRSLPNQKRTPEISALNEKMQTLKSYLPDPQTLDKLVPKNIKEQAIHINTSIHGLINECIKQKFYLEAITVVLFSHWMRLSVFFGVSEQEWQKMDYYLPDILEAVRSYLSSALVE